MKVAIKNLAHKSDFPHFYRSIRFNNNNTSRQQLNIIQIYISKTFLMQI